MLYAMREELVSSTMVDMVAIRHREVDLLSRQAGGLAFVFAVLSGVLADSMYTGYYIYYIRQFKFVYEFGAALSMYAAIFLPLHGLWRCVLLMAFAPFKALRGRPADLAATVDAFRDELVSAAAVLIGSVVAVFVTLVTFMLASQTPSRIELLIAGTEAQGSSGILAAIAGIMAGAVVAFAMWRLTSAVLTRFALPKHHAVAGEYWSDAAAEESEQRATDENSAPPARGPANGVEAGESDSGGEISVLGVRKLARLFDRDSSKELV